LDEYWRLIQRDFGNEKVTDAYGIKSITTGNKKLLPPLQAADVIAYGTWKCRAQKSIEPYLAEAYRELFKVKNTGMIFNQQNTEDMLQRVVNDLDARFGGKIPKP
jgi:hypothetical protein